MSEISVLAIGGAHLDRRGQITGEVTMEASNPGTFIEEVGGGVFNAASALARFGYPVRLIAPRGGDETAQKVEAAAEAAGISDTPITYLDRKTPSYTAILDSKGDLIIGLADMALYEIFSPRQIKRRSIRDAIAAASLLLVDANLPEPTLSALAKEALKSNGLMAAIAISPAKVDRLRPAFPALDTLFLNRREASQLTALPEAPADQQIAALRELGLQCAVMTDGAQSLFAMTHDGIWQLEPPQITDVFDVTGAGDALAAATLARLLRADPLQEAVRYGAAAAALIVTSQTASKDIANEDLTLMLANVGQARQIG